jgi:beta-phosphoglucomutase-like phosphatase (HAD superfamily)
MARPSALILDFDGVLVDSEHVGNQLLAELLTELGFPTTLEDTYDHYVGLAGRPFLEAIERRIGGPLPQDFVARRRAQGQSLLSGGVPEVLGAAAFVRSLPADLPCALASSSTTRWMEGHLAHLSLTGLFGPHLYSGHEHVERGKPEPDLYLHVAEQLRVPICDSAIVEDSPVGVRGALASGARVIGFCGGSHCRDGHGDLLRAEGVTEIALDFDELRRLLDL